MTIPWIPRARIRDSRIPPRNGILSISRKPPVTCSIFWGVELIPFEPLPTQSSYQRPRFSCLPRPAFSTSASFHCDSPSTTRVYSIYYQDSFGPSSVLHTYRHRMGNSSSKHPGEQSGPSPRPPSNTGDPNLNLDPQASSSSRSRNRTSRADFSLLTGFNPARAPSTQQTTQPEQRRETRAEREARRLERERVAREKERERSMREEHVDGGYLVTMGIYKGREDFNKPIVRQLQVSASKYFPWPAPLMPFRLTSPRPPNDSPWSAKWRSANRFLVFRSNASWPPFGGQSRKTLTNLPIHNS